MKLANESYISGDQGKMYNMGGQGAQGNGRIDHTRARSPTYNAFQLAGARRRSPSNGPCCLVAAGGHALLVVLGGLIVGVDDGVGGHAVGVVGLVPGVDGVDIVEHGHGEEGEHRCCQKAHSAHVSFAAERSDCKGTFVGTQHMARAAGDQHIASARPTFAPRTIVGGKRLLAQALARPKIFPTTHAGNELGAVRQHVVPLFHPFLGSNGSIVCHWRLHLHSILVKDFRRQN